MWTRRGIGSGAAALAAATVIAFGAGAGGASAAGPGIGRAHTPPTTVAPQLSFLHVGRPAGPAELAQIVDAHGREVLLRGVNVTGLRDDYVADGSLRPPYPETPAPYEHGRCPAWDLGVYWAPLCRIDASELASLGYDVVRLTVSWSLLEPQPGRINPDYIARIAQVVDWLGSHGIYTVIDMHQDAWSKYLYTPAGASCPPPTQPIGGFHEADGAPAWASDHVAPVCAVNGIRDLDPAVQEDFQRFYSDLPGPDGVGLQEHYAAALAALAAQFAADPAVAGYELLNEPEPGYVPPGAMDATELLPFYAKVIATVRATVPRFRQLFFIEPDITRDILDRSLVVGPWSLYSPYPNVVYAPHVYTDVFTLNAELGLSQLNVLYPSGGGYDSAAADARSLGLPLWVGEFGNSVAQDDTLLRAQYTNQDRLAVGGALWYWKGFAALDGHWSVLYDDATHLDAPYPSRIKFSDRAYPIYTAGMIDSLSYDPDTGAFTLKARSPRVRPGHPDRATVIYIPAADRGAVVADGASLRILDAPSGAREAFVYPRGGAYEVTVAG
jgi:endoglycosylceramidase